MNIKYFYTLVTLTLILPACQTLGESIESQESLILLTVDPSEMVFNLDEKKVSDDGFLFKIPMHAADMIKLDEPVTYKGIHVEFGSIGPKATYSAKAGQRFYNVGSDKYDTIYCRLEDPGFYNICLIDTEKNGTFDKAIHGQQRHVFGPGQLIKEVQLSKPIAYSPADTSTNLYYGAQYAYDKSRPRVVFGVVDEDGTPVSQRKFVRPEKEWEAPYALGTERFEIEILSISEDQSMSYKFSRTPSRKFPLVLN